MEMECFVLLLIVEHQFLVQKATSSIGLKLTVNPLKPHTSPVIKPVFPLAITLPQQCHSHYKMFIPDDILDSICAKLIRLITRVEKKPQP